MGGLSSHLYPWGFIVQGVALWHFVKRRPEGFWLYIIIFGSVLGAGVYVVVEMIPDLGLLRGTFQGFGGVRGFKTGDTDSGQSVRGESGGTGGAVF